MSFLFDSALLRIVKLKIPAADPQAAWLKAITETENELSRELSYHAVKHHSLGGDIRYGKF